MKSRIIFAFLLSLFLVLIFVLVGYASSIFSTSKQVVSATDSSLDCSNFKVKTLLGLSSYSKSKDTLYLIIQNDDSVKKVNSVHVKIGSRNFVYSLNLGPGEYVTLNLSNFSKLSDSFRINYLSIYPENCSSSARSVDISSLFNEKQ